MAKTPHSCCGFCNLFTFHWLDQTANWQGLNSKLKTPNSILKTGLHGALNRKVPCLMKLGYVPPKRLLLRADDEVRSPNLSPSTQRYFSSSPHGFRRPGL